MRSIEVLDGWFYEKISAAFEAWNYFMIIFYVRVWFVF